MSVPYDESVLTSTVITRAGRARRPMLSAALGAACISSSAILVTLARADAVTTAFFRCALALPVLVPLAVVEQRRLGRRSLRSRVCAVIAGLFLAVDLVLWNHAIADVGAGVATVLGNLQILFVAAFAWLVLQERPHRRLLVMLPVVLTGVVLVSGMLGGGRGAGLQPAAGVAFGVATSAAYACYLLILRRAAGESQHVAGQLADATAGAAVGSLAIGLVLGGLQFALPLADQLDTLAKLCERGYADRVMLSHDKASFTDWFTNAEQDFVLPDWQFTYIHGALLPGLRDRGVTDGQIEQMLVRNPREFFGG